MMYHDTRGMKPILLRVPVTLYVLNEFGCTTLNVAILELEMQFIGKKIIFRSFRIKISQTLVTFYSVTMRRGHCYLVRGKP